MKEKGEEQSAIAKSAAAASADDVAAATVATMEPASAEFLEQKGTTPSPVPVQIIPRERYEEAVVAVREHGVCVVSGVWTANEAAELSRRLDETKPVKTVNRRRQRFERVHRPDEPIFRELMENEIVSVLAKRLLGKDHYLEKAGVMISCTCLAGRSVARAVGVLAYTAAWKFSLHGWAWCCEKVPCCTAPILSISVNPSPHTGCIRVSSVS